MSDKIWKASIIVATAFMAAVAVASLIMGGCSGMLELANGNFAPMKCHWTFRVSAGEGIAAALIGIYGITQSSKEGRRAAAVALGVIAVLVLCECYFIIGICANATMACHTTRLVVTVLDVLALAAAVVAFAKADPHAAEKPKARL